MKTVNLITAMVFAIISLIALITAAIQSRSDLLILAIVFAVLSVISYGEYQNEKEN